MAKRKLVDKVLRVAQIRISDKHWERDYDDKRMEKLKDSIADRGQLHNIIVRPSKRSKATYDLLAGGRRFRAIRDLGLDKINVKVAEVDDVEAELISLDENLQVEHPTSADWAHRLERWRQLTNVQRGLPPDAKPSGGRPSKPKVSKSKGKATKNHRQMAEVSEPEPVSVAEMAEEHGVSERTVSRAQRRERNLTPEVKAAWRLGKLTDAQVDELAATPKNRQSSVLKEMMSQLAAKQQESVQEHKAELTAAKDRVELKKRLRACEDLCRRELVPHLIDLVGTAKEDDILVSRLSSVPTIKLTEARDLIDELLDILGS